MAGRIEPSKSSIMSQAKVKSIYQISSSQYKLNLCFNITFDEVKKKAQGEPVLFLHNALPEHGTRRSLLHSGPDRSNRLFYFPNFLFGLKVK
jgi:hypothetical protein